MATKLKKMKLTSVDLVRAGANQEADICLFKSATPPEATESPSEAEKNIFKRFLDWMRKNPSEDEYEPQNHIEKSEEAPDLEFIYKSALAESLQSIMQDDTLSEIEKKDMTEESLRQYADKIRELEHFDEDYDGGDDIDDDLIEEIDDFDKSDEQELSKRKKRRPGLLWDMDEYDDEIDPDLHEIDEIEEVEKYNHNHGVDGRFTDAAGAHSHDAYWASHQGASGGSGGGGGSSSGSKGAAKWHDKIKGASDIDSLDRIIEDAANDDSLSNKEYEEIYSAALSRAQNWDPGKR